MKQSMYMCDKKVALSIMRYFVDQICYKKIDNPKEKNTEKGLVQSSFCFKKEMVRNYF